MNLRWLDFIDRDELFFIPCAFLSPEVVWTFLKLLSIHGEIDDELQYDRQCDVQFSLIQHIRGSVFSLAVSDSELNEIREKYSFSPCDKHVSSSVTHGNFASDAVVTSVQNDEQFDDLEAQIRDMLDGQTSPTLAWSELPYNDDLNPPGDNPTVIDTPGSSISQVDIPFRSNALVDRCIEVVFSLISSLKHQIECNDGRLCNWKPSNGICIYFRTIGFTGFGFFQEGVSAKRLMHIFGADPSVTLQCNDVDIKELDDILRDSLIDVKCQPAGRFVSEVSQADHERALRDGEERRHCTSGVKEWTAIQFPSCKIQHQGLSALMKDYRFSSVNELHSAWGVQFINVRVILTEFVHHTESTLLWKVRDTGNEQGNFDAWCCLDKFWANVFDLHVGKSLSFFGAGLIGCLDDRPLIAVTNLSEGSAAVASPRYSQDIVIDFFSGIGGWQSGTNQRQVVSIEKDPVIASVHSKQTGAKVIGVNQILDMLLLDVESLPVILNFNVTDRRWWILFSLFRISYAVASPPCVSWSGASYAAGLDHEDGILFPETIAICDSHGVSRLALENVAAILGHKHWNDIKSLVQTSLGMSLHILKIDLQWFVPLRRIRAFIFICEEESFPEVVIPCTWKKRHLIQAGAWTPLFRACSSELQVSDDALKAATDPFFLPVEWKNGCIDTLLTTEDCLTLRMVNPWGPLVSSCMSQYGNQHNLSQRLLRRKGLLSFFIRDGRAPRGFRLMDPLEFAWLLGWGPTRWPRDTCLAFKILGNCVAPLHAKIAQTWIDGNWLRQPCSFTDLWNDISKASDGIAMLQDCSFWQDSEWIWYTSSSSLDTPGRVPTESVMISIFTSRGLFEKKAPFIDGLNFGQILSGLYPCDWSKVPLVIHGQNGFTGICNGNFEVTVFDVKVLVDGVGWIQISPLDPTLQIFYQVQLQRNIDISHLRLCIDGKEVDSQVLIAAYLPLNLYFVIDDFGGRFSNFLTPSVKRLRLSSGRFEPQHVVRPCELNRPVSVKLDVFHGTGQVCHCLTLEENCGLSYQQVVMLTLHDMIRPIQFEMLFPAGHPSDLCRGSFQVRLFDFAFKIESFGTESFSLFDRIRDIPHRISLKHFGRLIDLNVLCNGHSCDPLQFLGTTVDSFCFSLIGGEQRVEKALNQNGIELETVCSNGPFNFVRYKIMVHQTCGILSFEGSSAAQSTCQDVVHNILPFGSTLKWQCFDPQSGMLLEGLTYQSQAPAEFCIFVFDLPIRVEPHGIFFLPPFATLHDLLQKVSVERFGGIANLAVRVNNAAIDLNTVVVKADQLGVIRTQLFQGFGGSPVRSKLQTLLVQHGVPQESSSERATNLIEVCGVKLIEQALAMSNPWTAIKQQATAKKFQLITSAERYLSNQKDSIFESDPWAPKPSSESSGKGKGHGKGPKKQPRKKFEWGSNVIEETTLDLTFLDTGKNPVHKISWDALEQGTPGVCVLPFNTVAERRELIFSRNFSASPSIILTIGQIDPPPGKSSRCSFITIPGWLADKPVALNCTLIQVGDQTFPIPECKEITTSIPVHTICMIQVHRDEADSQYFSALQDGFAAYLRRLGLESWRYIESEWSQSFFIGRKKTDIESCQYFHNVVRIPDKHIKPILRLGGNAGIFVVPKNASRGIDDRFRVCLLKGLSLEETKQRLQDVPNHLGIARLKAGFGIRFEKGSYHKAKKLLLPDAPSSEDEAQQEGSKKFFLLGLPDSFDRGAVRKILRELDWSVGNIQSSGWKTWVVFSDNDPPVKDFLMAGSHVVITQGGSSTRHGVFAAGAVRGWKTLASLSNDQVKNAPTNFVTPASCPSVASDTPGVFESYKSENDGKIQALEAKVESIAQDIRKRDAIQNKEIGDIRAHVSTVEQKLSDLPTTFGGQIASLFDKFRIENQKTIDSVERRQSAQFDELRELFQQPSKARKVGDAESREQSRHSAT